MFSKNFNISIKHFYFLILLLVIFESLHAWFFWPFNGYMITAAFALLTILVATINPKMFSFKRESVIILIIIFLLARVGAVRGNINAYFGALILSFNIILFIALNRKYQMEAVEYLLKALSIVFGISLLAWFMFLIGIPFPFFLDTYGFSEERYEAQYFFNNHYLFLVNTGTKYIDLLDLLLPRFSSIVLEPGYFGILMVILLYLNKFNLRKKTNIVFLASLFFSFSLAGWLLGVFAYTIIALNNNINKVRIILAIIIGAFLFNLFFSSYKDGANPINEHILERLQYDDSRGTIAGYSRTGEEFEYWFHKYFLKSSELFYGSDYFRMYYGHSTNVGWKPFVAQNGLLGLSLYLFFLFYLFFRNRNFLTFGYFLLYVAIFARGHHEMFWAVYLILYISGCYILKSEDVQSKSLLKS